MKRYPKTYKRALRTYKQQLELRQVNECLKPKLKEEKITPSYTWYYKI